VQLILTDKELNMTDRTLNDIITSFDNLKEYGLTDYIETIVTDWKTAGHYDYDDLEQSIRDYIFEKINYYFGSVKDANKFISDNNIETFEVINRMIRDGHEQIDVEQVADYWIRSFCFEDLDTLMEDLKKHFGNLEDYITLNSSIYERDKLERAFYDLDLDIGLIDFLKASTILTDDDDIKRYVLASTGAFEIDNILHLIDVNKCLNDIKNMDGVIVIELKSAVIVYNKE
jgi:hypothetical protein